MWSLQDAKNRFSAVVEAALAGQPQQVSRRGKPAVVVLSARDYQELKDQAVAGRGDFLAHLMDFPVNAAAPDDALAPRAKVTAREVEF